MIKYYAVFSTEAFVKFSIIFHSLHQILSTIPASKNLLCIEFESTVEFQFAIDSTGNGLLISQLISLFMNFTIFVLECIFNHSHL